MSHSTAIVAEATDWLGTPYHHQASHCGVGADCLGLVRGVYRALYGYEPTTPPPYARYAMSGEGELLWQAATRYLLPSPHADILAGEVLVFRVRRNLPARHMAIYVGDAAMIHAMSGVGVCRASFSAWWQRRLVARFMFPPLSQNKSAAS